MESAWINNHIELQSLDRTFIILIYFIYFCDIFWKELHNLSDEGNKETLGVDKRAWQRMKIRSEIITIVNQSFHKNSKCSRKINTAHFTAEIS